MVISKGDSVPWQRVIVRWPAVGGLDLGLGGWGVEWDRLIEVMATCGGRWEASACRPTVAWSCRQKQSGTFLR